MDSVFSKDISAKFTIIRLSNHGDLDNWLILSAVTTYQLASSVISPLKSVLSSCLNATALFSSKTSNYLLESAS